MKLTTNTIINPPKIVIFGKQGHGKSRFTASFPKALFLKAEDRLAHLGVLSGDLIRSYEDLITQLDWVLNNEHDFKSVILDTADAVEKYVHEKIIKEAGATSITDAKKLAFYVGFVKAAEIWETVILRKLTEINENRKMIVCINSQMLVNRVSHPQFGDYETFSIGVDKRAATKIKAWADIVGFLDMKSNIKNISDDNETVRFGESNKRILRLRPQPFWDTKESYNLPDSIDLPNEKSGEFLGWGLLSEQIKLGISTKKGN